MTPHDRLTATIKKRLPRLQDWEVAALVKDIEEAGLLAGEWVSVKDRLPEEGQFVLATGHEYNNPMNTRWQIVSRFTKGMFPEFQSDFHDDTDVGAWAGETYTTHWQPLPKPPQADTGLEPGQSTGEKE